MKKWISILVLISYLLVTTELYQFLKIPVLIEHFVDHKSQNPKITFFGFLKIHYDNHVKDADWQTDQKLPFISHSNHLFVVFTLNAPFSLDVKENKLVIISHKIKAYNDAILDWSMIDSIWQPPKFC